MKIIFLDIDGVFNSSKYDKSDYYKQATAGMSDAEVMLTAHHLHLDPEAVAIFNDLVTRSGATVVLSSTWRTKYTAIEMTEMFKGRGGTFEVSDVTPVVYGKFSERIPRGKEIAKYLKDLPKQPESFVIIDDWEDMIHLKPFYVQTDYRVGLTQEDAERALKILNGDK